MSNEPKVILEGGTKLSRSLQRNEPLSIGQSRSAHLRIPHPSVGPLHCEVVWLNGEGVILRRRTSTLDLKVNGNPVEDEQELRHNDQVSVGLFTLRLEFQRTAAAPAPTVMETAPLAVKLRGQDVAEIPLEEVLVFGTDTAADVVLSGAKISPRHLRIRRTEAGYEAEDLGATGSLVNGRYFERHTLVLGDFLNLGEYWFAYDGFALLRVPGSSGCGLSGEGLRVEREDGRPILDDASFLARPGQFVGILGPSGAGKTTLLKALSGMIPVAAGKIEVDDTPLAEIPDLSAYFGFVPQEEIVHLDLTARQALMFGALLRLPERTPLPEIEKLIERLTDRLGLAEHLDKPARVLSGGQLKRLSVCVELLNRPPLLFLDEPTSGLDPEAETELMQQLQELTYTGCTVVATTHLMENVHLMNSVEVLMPGREPGSAGTSVFRGRPRAAREFFGVASLTRLYGQLKEHPPAEWKRRFAEKEESAPPARREPTPPRPSLKRRWAAPILLRRQWELLRARPKTLGLLVGQPLIIASLIALVAAGTDASATKLFLAYIAVLWLGCSNAATELVGERAVFQRERFSGLSTGQYLLAKFLGLSAITALQALLMLGILAIAGSRLDGSLLWQTGCLVACAVTAVSIGLAVSALSSSPLQAVLAVPVIVIPQILCSGYVFPVQEWNEAPLPRVLSRLAPSFAAQRWMDTSLLWNRPIENYVKMQQSGRQTAYDNLCTALYPATALWHGGKTPPTYPLRTIFLDARPATGAGVILLLWTLGSLALTWRALRRRET